MSADHDRYAEHAQQHVDELEAKQHADAVDLASMLVASWRGYARPPLRELRARMDAREVEIAIYRRVLEALPAAAKRDDERDEKNCQRHADLTASLAAEHAARKAKEQREHQAYLALEADKAAEDALRVFDSMGVEQVLKLSPHIARKLREIAASGHLEQPGYLLVQRRVSAAIHALDAFKENAA